MMMPDGRHSTASTEEAAASTRRVAYALLIVVASSIVGVAILNAPPAFLDNDRSRWATVRALGDTGSYSIGRRIETAPGQFQHGGILFQPGWRSVDVVMNPETRRFYSSKPLLLPTLVAGEYWLLRQLTGWRMRSDRVPIVRTILLTINWAPFVLYLIFFARLAERMGSSDWGRLFVLSCAGFGTFVSGYLVSLNNHTVAAAAALFAIYHCLRIHLDHDRRTYRFGLAGLFSGWAACNELPAAALAAGLMLWLLRLSSRETLRYAMPAMLLPIAVYLYVQYQVFGSVIPTYAFKEWYEFPGSFWIGEGATAVADPKPVYAFHLVLGRIGILSLTPVLFLGWMGMTRSAARRIWKEGEFTPQGALAALTLALTAVVLAFYIIRTDDYGGITAGPRWFLWLTPLWLLSMLPEADRWATRRRSRGLAYVLLAISIGSAMFALIDPWRYPWLSVLLWDWGVVSFP